MLCWIELVGRELLLFSDECDRIIILQNWEFRNQVKDCKMTALRAEYDGRAFVPSEHVDLPSGVQVEIWIPSKRRLPTAAEQREWDETLAELRAAEPEFPTVDAALRDSRKRP